MAQNKAAAILAALGGGDNVVEIEPCITRLRCEVGDESRAVSYTHLTLPTNREV